MAKVQVSHRLDEGLLEWATVYGESRGSSRAVVIEEALRSFRGLAEGGVPDLPAPAPIARPGVPGPRLVRASKLTPASGVMSERQARLNRRGS